MWIYTFYFTLYFICLDSIYKDLDLIDFTILNNGVIGRLIGSFKLFLLLSLDATILKALSK